MWRPDINGACSHVAPPNGRLKNMPSDEADYWSALQKTPHSRVASYAQPLSHFVTAPLSGERNISSPERGGDSDLVRIGGVSLYIIVYENVTLPRVILSSAKDLKDSSLHSE